ncbi:unnamed protein product [Rangifer tarandus platyrhynchus]|uniref:Uncharacterized protein n=1 Tax=Rangifer tarandus platyrhynchus TaxID=3082113 RepID=A0AC59YCV7_RANTA
MGEGRNFNLTRPHDHQDEDQRSSVPHEGVRHAPMLFASYSVSSQGAEIATPLELLRDTALTALCQYLFRFCPGPPGELKEQQITLKLL